jgi:integrase
MVRALRKRRSDTGATHEERVFPAGNGQPLRQENVRRRVLRPAAEEAGVPWAGFHAFRHTCASLLFERGKNVKQVSRWLGHHSASFTLDTYTHLLDEGVGDALDLDAELREGNTRATSATELHRTGSSFSGAETVDLQGVS